jgi:hypothetical protein
VKITFQHNFYDPLVLLTLFLAGYKINGLEVY